MRADLRIREVATVPRAEPGAGAPSRARAGGSRRLMSEAVAESTSATRSSKPTRSASSFGGVQALERRQPRRSAAHEILAIIGPNGAGKTSLLNVINGFYHPQRGTIRWHGTSRRRMRPHEAAAQGHRPHLPERGAVPRHDDAGQHHDRAADADAPQPVLAGDPQGAGRSGGAGAPRLCRAHHRLSRDRGDPQGAGRPARLRTAEAGRTRRGRWRWSRNCCCSTSRWPA